LRKHEPGSPTVLKKIRHDAFTLVELLVVLATVGILAAVLLPALAATHSDSQSFQCMENQRQLILGWQMYAEDDNDLLPPNDYPYLTAYALATSAQKGQMKNWVVGTMAISFDARDLPAGTGISELLDPNTLLSPYVTNKLVYHCPADHYIDPRAGRALHVRSVSMNSAVGTTWNAFYASGAPPLGAPVQGGWLMGASYSPNSQLYLTYGKMSSFTKPGPANTWVMMDENPMTINDPSMATSAVGTPGHTYLVDFPGGSHNGAAGMSFADGHVLIHKWRDSRTYTPAVNLNAPGLGGVAGGGLQSPDDPDCFYLASITSALR
jgi:prepilin-type N-terminal cleavage/methylation domain-containing protein/prepilin-type processing-associated H-X9-DG protein